MREGEGKGKAVHLCHSHAPHSEVLLFQTLNPEEQLHLQVCSGRLAEGVVFAPISQAVRHTKARRFLSRTQYFFLFFQKPNK